MQDYSLFFYIGAFAVIALASDQIGRLAARLRLPLITGYLLTGIVVGPFLLDIISTEAVHRLHFVEEISLAVIAFAAGGELYLKEIRSQLRSITINTIAQLGITFIVGAGAVYLLTSLIPFTQGMSTVGRAAVALLAATILLARSPSSAIAIIRELRAKGPFTKTTMGVTVIADVAIILLFALNVQVADAIFTDVGFNLSFVVLLGLALILSLAAGFILHWLIQLILSTRLSKLWKIVINLVIAYGVFEGAAWLRVYSHAHLPFEIALEPLLICMIAAFLLINFTKYRDEFTELIEITSPYIYIAFFTLTGDAIQIDILLQTLPIALALFAIRIVALLLAGLAGGTAAGDPVRHRTLSWMAYVTQAGVGLGLAQEAAAEFPELGSAFATMMISVIILSQIAGPPLMKLAIRRAGEAHDPGETRPGECREAVIVGVEGQSIALARLLRKHDWSITIADTDRSRIAQLDDVDVFNERLPGITHSAIRGVLTECTDALVAMLDNDADNFTACEAAYEQGVKRIVVRLNDITQREKFRALGVWLLDPSSAMIGLLEQFVRAPHAAAQFIYDDPEHDTAQISVTDRDATGIALNDLRLPTDVLVLSINRRGQSIVPHGYTVLHLSDEVTAVGSQASLEEVTRRLGY